PISGLAVPRARWPCTHGDSTSRTYSKSRRSRNVLSRSLFAKDTSMSTIKHATPNHPIHELLARRWSPYAFADRPVSKEDLQSLFEAARWAPSSSNEQPWSYIVATRDEPQECARLLSCLVEGNQAWAQAAPVLAIGCASL